MAMSVHVTMGGMLWPAGRAVAVAYTRVPDACGTALPRLVERLPAAEQDRAARFRLDDDRARFTFGRLLLRQLIGGRGSLDIEESGRPIVVGSRSPLFVSLTHSGRYVAAALARRPVGIDVEACRGGFASDGLVARVCSPVELSRLDALAGEARDRAFMTIWVRKEAYGKALGVGVGFDLRSVTVGPTGDRAQGVGGRWSIVDLDLDPGYASALVVAGGRASVRLEAVDPAAL